MKNMKKKKIIIIQMNIIMKWKKIKMIYQKKKMNKMKKN